MTLVTICSSFALSGSASAEGNSILYVQTMRAKLRKEPLQWSASAGDLQYGDNLSVIEQLGAWYRVRSASDAEGYVHESAVTKSKVIFLSASAKSQINPQESDIVLAGKGFNKELEKNYAVSGQDLNYNAVDAMERVILEADDRTRFMREGKLNFTQIADLKSNS